MKKKAGVQRIHCYTVVHIYCTFLVNCQLFLVHFLSLFFVNLSLTLSLNNLFLFLMLCENLYQLKLTLSFLLYYFIPSLFLLYVFLLSVSLGFWNMKKSVKYVYILKILFFKNSPVLTQYFVYSLCYKVYRVNFD